MMAPAGPRCWWKDTERVESRSRHRRSCALFSVVASRCRGVWAGHCLNRVVRHLPRDGSEKTKEERGHFGWQVARRYVPSDLRSILGQHAQNQRGRPLGWPGVEGVEKYGHDFWKQRDFSEQLLWGQVCYIGDHFIPKTAL